MNTKQTVMKLSIYYLLFFYLNFSIAQETFTLNIEFTDIKSNNGSIFVGLYDNENNFLKQEIKGAIVKIVNKKASYVFEEIKKGEYAVSSFHDKNNNKKLDVNLIGIPTEPIAVSNNAKGFMGPPKYKDAKFKIIKDTYIEIIID